MNNTAEAVTTLVVKRFIKAPRASVYAAWTKPEEILKWFGPKTCQALAAEIDLREGGQYRLKVRSQEMGDVEVRGVYREVVAPSRLVFTWAWANQPAMDIGESLVTVEFFEVEGGTDVHLTHEGLPHLAARDSHAYGWNGCMDKLDVLFGGEEDEPEMPLGSFCWNELLVRDPRAEGEFYGKLFGWGSKPFPMGDMNYTIFKDGDRDAGGMMPLPMPDVPPHWLAYVKVADVNASAKLAGELGGKVIAGPFDISTIGRIAVVMDPEGAAFGLYKRFKS